MTTPLKNLPKYIAIAVNSFKSTLDLYLGDLSRNTQIYSYRTVIDVIISSRDLLITVVYPYYTNNNTNTTRHS